MAKYKCSICGAPSDKEQCWKHSPRKPLRRSALKAKPIAKRLDKPRRQWDFFMEIWKERPHVSEVSGTPLYGEPLSIYFDHLLEKETYPQYRYEKWNIALVTWEEHDLKGKGFPLPKHQELIGRAKNIHNGNNYNPQSYNGEG